MSMLTWLISARIRMPPEGANFRQERRRARRRIWR